MNDEKDLKSKPRSYWRERLTPEEFDITRNKGTEAPFSGTYDDFFEEGEYSCVSCGKMLFLSDAKYPSGCGWPSFDQPGADAPIGLQKDDSNGMQRTEVLCENCNAHLGHVFEDGPTETGMRYCINSAALKFHKK